MNEEKNQADNSDDEFEYVNAQGFPAQSYQKKLTPEQKKKAEGAVVLVWIIVAIVVIWMLFFA